MAYQHKTDTELQEIWRGVTDEINRRAVLASAPGDLDDILTRVLEAQGLQPGDPWRAPSGGHDAYPQDWTVTHDGRTWISRVHCNVEEPGQGENWEEEVTDA